MNIEACKAYEIVERRFLPDIESEAYLLRHTKSGARIFLISNTDENKVFSIAFRTPPVDSTGLTHILEHSVLCGSKAFPVKDPFVELAKGSMNTFLNAMTYPDKTVYPVASCNDKDFQNLMHVYLDAIFYPNIYEREEIFRQEGWHYEMDDPDGELTINGVVYNEMKGVFSSPEGVLEREILNSLFPDTPYCYESGGDPEVIPELTYEKFLDFHRTYYHPSNSYIYLYGNMDMEEKLNWMDAEYLSKFDRIAIDTILPLQKPFEKPVEVRKEYSVTGDDATEDNTYLSLNYAMKDCLDRKLYMAFYVLDYALISSPGAPLKQALLDAGIGKDIMSSYECGIRQPMFSIIAKNANESDKERFLTVIRESLEQIVRDGLDQNTLRASINSMEFSYREADSGRYPIGLYNGLSVLNSWLYDETEPFIHLEENEIFAFLKEQVDRGYFEQLITDWLLENPHCSVVIIAPKAGLTALNDQALKEKLQAYKETLSDAERAEIVARTEHLKAYQSEPSTQEELETIPLLTLDDMRKKAEPYVNRPVKVDDTVVLYHDVETKGIAYITMIFGTAHVTPEEQKYMAVLSQVLSYVDTAKYSYQDLSSEINIHTGGLSSGIAIGTKEADDQVYARFTVNIKAIFEEMPKVFELLQEVICTSDLTDDKRLKEIVDEMKSRMQMQVSSAGHSLASVRGMSYFSESADYIDRTNGIAYYEFISDLAANFDARKDTLKAELSTLCKKLFTPDNLMVDVTEKGMDEANFAARVRSLKEVLFAPGQWEPVALPTLEKKNEGFKTASKVNYVARCGNFKNHGFEYTGVLRVLRIIMSYDYLWQNVRVLGGAYGCMSSFDRNGDAYFVSYRDPNLADTETIFEGIPEYLENFNPEDRDMLKFIIGTFSMMDTPLTPSAKGKRSLMAYVSGITIEQVQTWRDQVLHTTKEDIRALAPYVRAILEDDCRCVIGDETAIEAEKTRFDTVSILQ